MRYLKFTIIKLILFLSANLILVSCSTEQKKSGNTLSIPEIISPPISERNTSIDNNKQNKANRSLVTPFDSTQRISKEIIATAPSSKFLSKNAFIAETLSSHNKVRRKHGLSPLKWSDHLATYSQQWANELGKGNACTMRHRSGTPPYGENLYWSSPVVWTDGKREIKRETNPVSIRDVVKVWADEEQWYNYQRNSCQPGQRCGHYTQIVWKNTTEVGCAMKICPDQSQTWVCSYNPPGNFMGMRPY